MSVILLSEALRILHSGEVCSLTYVAADFKRGTGGKIIHVPQCVIYSKDESMPEQQPTPNDPHTPTSHVSRLTSHDTPQTQTQTPSTSTSTLTSASNPSHHLHKTRNIYIPATRQIQKLHIKLIIKFNGKKVLL